MGRKARSSQESHPDREWDTRAEWEDAAILEAPPARPGFRQRWVSTSILGQDIPQQVARRLRQGWTPRPADTVPDSYYAPTVEHGQFEGCVGVEGMILCELPEDIVQARTRHYKGITNSQSDYVDKALKDGAKSGRARYSKESDLEFNRGNKVASD